ncbi:RICIN domain-containing protein [Egicoccus halophilus]|uniref:F5/8 type C domain-containing protein n=1 Tax=Egicoccus halophilus TaxID=1670830 RepID=A0A8J3A5N1_9ACTN|nr:RICIN domain-containing protein [Egicoccus halophilus]GGI03671.1 hypothetical protein GCM10011354_05200 [Egicoccus halophilus]
MRQSAGRTALGRRGLAGLGAAALVAGLGLPAAAEPGANEVGDAATATAQDVTSTVTVRPDPSYHGETFEGWGTSLVWFANATGDYPDEIRERLYDLVFGDEGLRLNLARYNVGGGNAPDVEDYLRPGGAVEGWWQAPEGTTRTDRDWWDPNDPDHWNDDADATQRWWVDRIRDDIDHWEAFSNSPPYFQTVSGYVSGGFNATAEQIRPDTIDDFVAYLVGVVERLEDAHGIEVDTIDPFNEPNTNYWSTTLDASGEPVGGRQEGAHVGPGRQQQVIRALADELADADTDAVIAAMDETNPGTFLTNWNAYAEDVREHVEQLNVHTYGTGQRTAVRDIAKGEDKRLWMSEVGGSWLNYRDFESMVPALGLAQHMVSDMRELEPSAWVFWQPVEDYDNMAPGGESAAGMNWGKIHVPFDCTEDDTLETCQIEVNRKFDSARNFTHFLRPGDVFVGTNDANSVAAVNDTGVNLVHVNATAGARAVELDLSGFADVAADATVTPVVTDADGSLVEHAPVAVADGTAVVRVPAQSVTTLVVDGVSGVADDAALIQSGHVYRLEGVQSGRSLTPSGDAVVIRSRTEADASQLFAIERIGEDRGARSRYAVSSVTDGRQLAVHDGGVRLVAVDAADDPTAQWILSTTGDGTYTLVNVASKRLLEVGGQSTAEGAGVGVWLANSGNNQRWRIVDETVVDVEPVEVFTTPDTRPTMPDTVVPLRRDGSTGAPIDVDWNLPGDGVWRTIRTHTVRGVATDLTGRQHRVEATVVVDTLTDTLPARAKAFVGGVPDLPDTVDAVGRLDRPVPRPVVWEDVDASRFSSPGVVTVEGVADAGDGRQLPATVRVQVTEPVFTEDAALTPGTTASASFTEPGYSAARLINGVLDDKAWSNWRSGTKNASDTLTVTLPEPHTVGEVVTHFYADGSHQSWAESLRVEARDADGTWQDVSGVVPVTADDGGAPVVSVGFDPVVTDDVRVVLAARPNTHMTVSAIQVLAAAPGVSDVAEAATIAVDGVAVPGFAPEVTEYTVGGVRVGHVTAVAADPYATVTVDQPTRARVPATVTIVSEDGTTSRTYTIAPTSPGRS